MYANPAVKNGVVAPIAWLKETGRNCSEIFPLTTEKQKMTLRAEILRNCIRERIGCRKDMVIGIVNGMQVYEVIPLL